MARQVESSKNYSKLGISITKLPEQKIPKKIIITYFRTQNGWRYELRYSAEYLKWRKKLTRIETVRHRRKYPVLQNREKSFNRATTLLVTLFRHLSSSKT
jgi:hypothetical protein